MLACRRRLPWLPLLAFLLLLSACAAHDMEGRPMDLGQSREGYLKDGVYHNDFYHFTWKAPQGWSPVKPTPLEALVSRPSPDRGYMFGWANPAQQAEIRFLVFPPTPETAGECSPKARSQEAVRGQNWRLQSEQPGQWQGMSALQVHYATGGTVGQPSQAVLTRYVCVGQDLLVFQLQLPAMDYNSMHDLFQELVRQVEFAKSRDKQAPQAKPAAPPDLAHTVKYAGETLAAIAQWYTGSPNYAGRIQTHNQLLDTRLNVGQQIKVPGELVTNRNPMPPPIRKKPAVKPTAKPGEGGESAEPAPEPAAPAPEPPSLKLEPIGPK